MKWYLGAASRVFGYALWATLLLFTVACAPAGQVQQHSPPYPQRLSEWGLFERTATALVVGSDSATYTLNTALFSDYAYKLRTLHLPAGETARYAEYDAFEFPQGTIISKTFFYAKPTDSTSDADIHIAALSTVLENKKANQPVLYEAGADVLDLLKVRLLETRLLIKQADGWHALPYVWRDDDAYLAITGDLLSLTTTHADETGTTGLHYLVPSKNQCASCHAYDHTSGAIQPLGLRARHLNRRVPHEDVNQLARWAAAGILTGLPDLTTVPRNASLDDHDATLVHRARSYLDINCGHCHNPVGAADTSGLMLDYQAHSPAQLGECKPPIAAGRGSGGHLYSIVPGAPEASILTYRMSIRDPGSMMPELGRTLVHKEGLAVVSDWIASLQGVCR